MHNLVDETSPSALARSQEIISASWTRCAAEYNLRETEVTRVVRISDQKVRQLRSDLRDVLGPISFVINGTREVARRTNHVVMLSNSEGIVVESYADSPAGEELRAEGLDQGTVWAEAQVGTNGIGTTLSSRQGVTVSGASHFSHLFRGFSCSAAPVIGSFGEVVAAIDLSTRTSIDASTQVFANHFVQRAASELSAAHFHARHKDQLVLVLSDRPDCAPFTSHALIAVDEYGLVSGATQQAIAALGVPNVRSILGSGLGALWDVSLDQLLALNGRCIRLPHAVGPSLFASFYVPPKKSPSQKSDQVFASRITSAESPLDKVAGQDPAAWHSVEICRKIIDKDISILIQGETGAGKDTLARGIHCESARSRKPYVAINCGAIPDTLLSSELFGYEPGTFTGGTPKGRIGKILAANGGTVFLDEIGDMPTTLQAHLLRVLEERVVAPLGSTREIPIDVKFICATHHDLAALVASGKFRRDLYYRISGAQVTLPPLRKRVDLGFLVQQILREEIGVGADIPLSQSFLEHLGSYWWPGNIRELRSVLRLIVSMVPDLKEVSDAALADISSFVPSSEHRDANLSASSFGREGVPYVDPAMLKSETGELLLSDVRTSVHRHIIDVLRRNRWGVTAAAAELGISRATLHRKIRKFGIVFPNRRG